jgi:hypothetical protein
MPLYEYVCEETGETIELIRPMADADAPVTEADLGPERKGRRYVRKLSTFQAKSDAGKRVPLPTPGAGPGCGCGNPMGPCNIN